MLCDYGLRHGRLFCFPPTRTVDDSPKPNQREFLARATLLFLFFFRHGRIGECYRKASFLKTSWSSANGAASVAYGGSSPSFVARGEEAKASFSEPGNCCMYGRGEGNGGDVFAERSWEVLGPKLQLDCITRDGSRGTVLMAEVLSRKQYILLRLPLWWSVILSSYRVVFL